jgi:hypothetical protein
LEDTFGPMPPVLKVRSLDEVFGADAPMVRAARDKLGAVERTVKAFAAKRKNEDPPSWRAQIAGVRAEIGNATWVPKDTLDPLLKMVSAHLGHNRTTNLLPHYPAEYERCARIRNALAHDNWDEVQNLGGARAVDEWASCLEQLVNFCTVPFQGALLQHLGGRWPWPALPKQ